MPAEEDPVVRTFGNKIAVTRRIPGDIRSDAQVIKKCLDIFDNFSSTPGGVFAPDCHKFRTYPADFHTGTCFIFQDWSI
jgi:hypothetical protein